MAILGLLLGAMAPTPAQGSGWEVGPRTYRPPTAAPVADPYRPPPEPWLPGNRGIEYATEPDAPVGAIGPGVVAFAGQVGGRLVVAVDHPDGLRSSYVGLALVGVRVHDVILGGQQLGRAAGPVHLGVRRGTTYLDPATLWGTVVVGGRTVLVPIGGRAARSAEGAAAGRPRGDTWAGRRAWWW